MARDSILDLKRKIDRLERSLMSEEDLPRITSQFLALTATDRRLLSRSERCEEMVPLLQMAVLQIGEQVFGSEVEFQWPALLRIPRWGFTHGTVSLAGRPASLIFFEHLGVGLISILMGDGDVMHHTRFTAMRSPPTMN